MLEYVIKSAACLAILFIFYKVFLEKEDMHVFKRFYLLGALLFSLTVPFVVFTEYVEIVPEPIITELPILQQRNINEVTAITDVANSESYVLNIVPILWIIYGLGVFFFGIKFVRNLGQIYSRIQRNPKQKNTKFTKVLLQEKVTPHTFFSFIFLNKKRFENKQIPHEVLLHEETHAIQKHSFDVVLIEVLLVFLWINPFILFIKKAIKLNHEFLADQAVLRKNIDKTRYQNTILSYLAPESTKNHQPLANAINYSSIKKRFTIMKTHTSKKAVLLRTLLMLPLLAALLLSFSKTEFIAISTPDYTVIENKPSLDGPKLLETSIQKKSTEPKAKSIAVLKYFPKKIQEGASRELMKEYNSLAKKYNTMLSESKRIRIKKQEVDRLKFIYSKMSDKQKEDAAPFPDFPAMPEKPIPPAPPQKPQAPQAPQAPQTATKAIRPIAPPSPANIHSNAVEEIIETQEVYDEVSVDPFGSISTIPSAATPPTPPSPKSPIDHIIEMAKKDATFYFEGKQITSDKAIELMKNDENLNIQSISKNGTKPVVKLSTEPVTIMN